jgi:uroporphyrin-III C-methyltransferase/precorrin-2 dehydrogenase/sirohydrochlorin ferrochelatase
MQYFPAYLQLDGRQCLVVGGEIVAARKAKLLLEAGAVVTVVAPALVPPLQELASRRAIEWQAREFAEVDLEGCWLVVDATGIEAIRQRISKAAMAARVFCNSVDNLANSSFITPAIVNRDPVVVAVSSGGAAPVLARRIRARIESLLPASLGRLAAAAGRWRGRVRTQIERLTERRRFWERFFDIASSGNGDNADEIIATMLEGQVEGYGEAWLVGAGPGDPDLLTLGALHCMQAADVIIHDRLVSEEVLALARRDAECILVGKTPGCRRNSQEEINALLVDLVSAGKRVCRLKGGDPFIFGRGGEEAKALQDAGLPHRVVPGITAAAGCAAAAGIPLTHRDAAQSVVFLTAHGKDSVDTLDWASLSRDRQTLVFYMVVQRFPEIMNNLIAHGRRADTPVAIVERGTTPGQRVIRGTLGQLTLLAQSQGVVAPAVLFIGDVAHLGVRQSLVDADQFPAIPDAIPADSAIHRTANQ